MTPKVSIIVPNYNYARFLPQRLDSILAQSFQDFEIILLDDASTDNSREVMAPYLSNPRIRCLNNERNSGNPFVQWNRGVSAARGEYVWLAEADDYAAPNLLAELVDQLDRHPEIGVAYVQSWSVDEDNKLHGTYLDYTATLNREHWCNDYVASGHDECFHCLVFMNTIPNASAAVFRRSLYEQIGGADESFRLAGDWDVWLRLAFASGVAFVKEPLNYFRSHQSSMRSKSEDNGVLVEETARVLAKFARLSNPPRLIRKKMGRHFLQLWIGKTLNGGISFGRQWRIFNFARRFDRLIGWRLTKEIFFWMGRKARSWVARATTRE